jgi:Fic family protein
MNYINLTYKKNELDNFRPLPLELVNNLEDWFRVELTYTSNAIEGNTLSRREIALVIEKGLTVGGKSLIEHVEATNHAKALDFVHEMVKKKPSGVSAHDILAIHNLILKNIDDANAGHYRNVAVRISGSNVVMPNPYKVPELMDEFQIWLNSESDKMHPIAFASEAHYRLVTIHPFADGNGRTARLLMNLILMMFAYPPAIIRKKDRLDYIISLEKAQLGGSKEDYEKLIAKAVDRSLDIYLKAARGESSLAELDNAQLLKIGQLAKATGENTSTLRYWTKEGLLNVVEVTKSGYQLYSADMILRCKAIKKLQSERLTLEEIKTSFKSN